MKYAKAFTFALAACVIAAAGAAQAGPREDILASFAAEAPGNFDAARGAAMYSKNYASGKPETPKCTSCHGATPQQGGQTRAGKPIEAMAVSETPDRFTDPKKVAKWFRRNCKSVIGRECTAQEKGDFITYMVGQ
jgi:hypothetical protein